MGKVKTVSVKREGKRWYVVLTAEQAQPEPLSPSGSVVGIDMDIVSFLTTSNGEHVKAPTPKPDPETPGGFLPNGFAAKAGLNHSISDAGWGVFLTILHAKAESAGRNVIAVDPRRTSRTCPECGHVSAENRPTQETFYCVGCGHLAHADTVGALNVLRAGLARREAALA